MGAYLAIISGAIKLFNYIAAGLQQHHDELNGAMQQRGADDEAAIKTILDTTGPTSSADVERMWASNKAKFDSTQPAPKQ